MSASEPEGEAVAAPARQPWTRMAADYLGPLAFAVGYFTGGRDMLAATWWLVGGSAVGLILAYAVERRVAVLPAVWGGAALVFGLLTLAFHDPRIIKMKVTALNLALGIAMAGGVLLNRNPLKAMIGDAIRLPDAAWRTLTWRYAVFFLALAVVNEVVWRTQPESTWVLFRMPGLLILSLLFSLAQAPLMLKAAGAAEARAALTEVEE